MKTYISDVIEEQVSRR